MKKFKKILLVVVLSLFMLPSFVNASSGTISVSSTSTGIVGNNITVKVTLSSASTIGSWEFDISYDKSYLQLTSSTAESGGTHAANTVSGGTKSKSYNFTFKVLKSGSTTVKVSASDVYDYNDMSRMSMTNGSKTITLKTQAEIESSYSKDNSLKSLSVEGYEITPEFNKDTLEYKVTVPSDVNSVNIIATKSDSKATVTGDKEHEVVEGSNRFEIVVTAENGSEKKYVLTVEVEDLNPISIKIDDKNYTIIKRKENLTKPNLYEEATITINEIEVPAFKSDITKFTLVGIKDEEGKIYLALYNEDDNSYTIYNEFTSSTLSLYLTDFPKKIDGYIKDIIKINEIDTEVYRYSKNSRFVICYGINLETGKYNYYSYDTKENTFQIYNDEEIKELKNTQKLYLYVIIAFAIALLFAFIIIISLAKRNKKIKNKNKIEVLNEKILETDDDVKKATKKNYKKKKDSK